MGTATPKYFTLKFVVFVFVRGRWFHAAMVFVEHLVGCASCWHTYNCCSCNGVSLVAADIKAWQFEGVSLVACGCWLVAGGSWLVAGGWWLLAGGWWLVAGG